MSVNLLSLPLEIRLQIYSYLHAPNLVLNLCEDLTGLRLANCAAASSKKSLVKRTSPLLSFLRRRSATTCWSRTHGLHLTSPESPSILRGEYTCLLRRAGTKLLFHCPNCLSKLLHHLVVDLGITKPLLQDLRMRVDFRLIAWSWEGPVERLIDELKLLIGRIYGNGSFWDGFDEDGNRVRIWWVERVRIVGRVPQKAEKRKAFDPIANGTQQEEHEMDFTEGQDENDNLADDDVDDDDEDEDEDQEDDNDDLEDQIWFASRRYKPMSGVREIERLTSRFDVSNPERVEMERLRHVLRHLVPAMEEGEWRKSRMLERELAQRGKSTKRVVCREEVWIGVNMR